MAIVASLICLFFFLFDLRQGTNDTGEYRHPACHKEIAQTEFLDENAKKGGNETLLHNGAAMKWGSSPTRFRPLQDLVENDRLAERLRVADEVQHPDGNWSGLGGRVLRRV